MSCCKDIAHIAVSISALSIYDGAITAGNYVHDGMLTFPCAAFSEGNTGRILQAMMQLNNDSSAAITSGFVLHLYKASITTVPVKGNTPATVDADHANYLGEIDFGDLSAIVGDSNVSKSHKLGIGLEYKVSDTDTAIYGFLTSKSNPTINNNATINIKLICSKD